MATTRADKNDSDDPYTYHVEPRHVGRARYVRCERCGAELVPPDPDRLLHVRGCPEGDR